MESTIFNQKALSSYLSAETNKRQNEKAVIKSESVPRDTGDILRQVIVTHKIRVRHISRAIGIDPHAFYRYISENPKLKTKLSADRLGAILRALPDEAKLDFYESFAFEKTD